MNTTYTAASPACKAHRGQGRMLTVKKRDGARLIPVHDILYAESFGRKVVLHLKDGQLEYYEKIGDLERTLGHDFYRVHRSYLVRMDMIRDYTRGGIVLKNGDVVWLSKYKYADFVKTYERYGTEKRAG